MNVFLYLRVYIFDGDVVDEGSHAGIGQSLKRFLEMRHQRVDARDHEAI